MKKPDHCLIIGLDGAVPEVVEKLAGKGIELKYTYLEEIEVLD